MWHTVAIASLRQALRERTLSSVELTEHFLSRIREHNASLNAYIHVDEEDALQQARQADEQRAKSDSTAPWLGIPMAHKDIFCTINQPTTCCSKMLQGYCSPFDATIVSRFKAQGAVMLGKLNMDEFAMGSSNETSTLGPCFNPWDLTKVPGGSSGGSASSVAARLTPLATGTDTGGSIRQPAAYCGITGLKPTYGRVSRYGMIAFASSLDQAGPMAASAADCAEALQVMAGHDPHDMTSSHTEVPDYLAALDHPLKGRVIGIDTCLYDEQLDRQLAEKIFEVAKTLEAAGAKLKDITMPRNHLALPVYYVIAPAECSSNLARFDGIRYGYRCDNPESITDLYERSRDEAFGPEVKRRILLGTFALSSGFYDAYYMKSQRVRRLIRNDYDAILNDVDVILGPTAPTTAFTCGSKSKDPVSMYLSDIYTIPANLAGLPAMAAPCGFQDGLPVSFHLTGRAFDESTLLNVVHQYQQHTDWHQQVPPAFQAKQGVAS